MRLKSVLIKEYKNLRDFSIDFAGDSFLDIFVGKNGSGKSNTEGSNTVTNYEISKK